MVQLQPRGGTAKDSTIGLGILLGGFDQEDLCIFALGAGADEHAAGGGKTLHACSPTAHFSFSSPSWYLTMLLTKATGSVAAGRRGAALLRRCCVFKDNKPPSVHSRHLAASAGATAPRHKTHPKHDFEPSERSRRGRRQYDKKQAVNDRRGSQPRRVNATKKKKRYSEETAAFAQKLNQIARGSSKSAAQQAQDMLNDLIRRIDSGKNVGGVSLNTILCTTVINAWARRGRGEEAEALLNEMEERFVLTKDDNIRPDAYLINCCITAWSRCKRRGSAARAELLLERLINDQQLQPDTFSFAGAITARSRSKERGSAARAMQLLERMEEMDLEPNNIVLSSVIHALANTCSGEEVNAEGAVRLLDRMDQPDSVAFNSVLHALSKSGEEGSAKSAQALLERMERLSRRGNEQVRPTVQSYTSVIMAWSRAKEPAMAERVLQRLERSDAGIQPDTAVFTSVINSHITSEKEGSLDRASELLSKMEDLRLGEDANILLTPSIYHALMTAYARNKNKEGAEKVQVLLERMEKLRDTGCTECTPTAVSYRIAMRAWKENRHEGYGDKVKALHARMTKENS